MTDARARLTAALADRYRLERELGQGGMATVYLASDLKHERKVAVKVLKPELAAVLGAERFVVEIKTTAALQHPHILPLFDSGEADGFLYYVMPFIDGETLRTRLDREAQLGVEEAVRIAREVADALHHAHEHGVIHRDIKPENILLANGRPMVADFGIALAVSAAAGGRMTETGLSLGTPHYMSPEQATAEREITRRSDIYSLASVLYEMLAGNPPHVGSTAQQIIMKIITERAADVTTLRKSVPPHVAAALAQALEKLPADRFETADAFARALVDRGFTTTLSSAGRGVDAGVRADGWRQRAAVPLAVATIALASFGLWAWQRPAGGAARAGTQPVWLSVDPPGERFEDHVAPTLSPDGTRLAFYAPAGPGKSQLWVRALRSPAAQPVPGVIVDNGDVLQQPFWSADGTSLAFFANGALHRVDLDGRAPQRLADAPNARGGTWNRDGVIVFVPSTFGLARVSATGGAVTPIGDTLPELGTIDRWPHFLPDGRHFLFVRRKPAAPPAVYVGSLDSPEIRLVLEVPSRAEYADGRLYFVRDGALLAQPFDTEKFAVTGTAVRVVDDVGVNGADYRNTSFSAAAGHVATWSGMTTRYTRLMLVDAAGRMIRQIGPTSPYLHVATDPSGTRLAVERVAGSGGIPSVWLIDVGSGQASVLATPAEGGGTPAWLPDGRSVLYTTFTMSTLVRQAVGSSDSTSYPVPISWISGVTPDGRQAVAQSSGRETGLDVLLVPLDAPGPAQPLLATAAGETMATVSPDGRWVAYQSDASGRYELYVESFPVSGRRQTISDGGGYHPEWSRDGRTLYYLDKDQTLMAARLTENGATLTVARTPLFRIPNLSAEIGARRPYAVLPDGHFVINVFADTVVKRTLRVGLDWAAK